MGSDLLKSTKLAETVPSPRDMDMCVQKFVGVTGGNGVVTGSNGVAMVANGCQRGGNGLAMGGTEVVSGYNGVVPGW